MMVLRNLYTCAPKTRETIENSIFRFSFIRGEEVVDDGVEELVHLRAKDTRNDCAPTTHEIILFFNCFYSRRRLSMTVLRNM